MVVTSPSISVLENVQFTAGHAAIAKRSCAILDAVAATLAGNQDIALVEIQGHTDDRGDAAVNLALSHRRARAVRDYMLGKGVAPTRLIAEVWRDPADRSTCRT
ncbi:MAG: OmpA family protein [Kofleriaceae bacterium]